MPQSSSTCLTVSAGFLRQNGQSEDAGSTRSSVKVSKARTFRREGFILIGFEKLRLQVEGISCRSYEYMPLELRLTFSNLIGRRRSGENLVVLVLKSGKSSRKIVWIWLETAPITLRSRLHLLFFFLSPLVTTLTQHLK